MLPPASLAKSAKLRIHTVPGWGEVVELGELPEEQFKRVEVAFTSNDYPPRSLREGNQGLVEAWVVVGPNGRVAQVGIVRAPDRGIAIEVSGLLQRRIRMKFDAWPGKFVRVKLPPIQFRIRDCDGSYAIENVSGGITVDSERDCRPLISLPATDGY
jgi:hypothetical protein